MTERMLADLSAASAMTHIILRYFNVAGADPKGRIGQSTRKATLLTKVACEAALGRRRRPQDLRDRLSRPPTAPVCGTISTWKTSPRLICKALDYLAGGGSSRTLNCGYGHGYSVREVLAAVARANGRLFRSKRRSDGPGILRA